ncbi:uncharacterized protein LOC131539516 isoform X1 [Onychostoma macrolepis]|uniref:uncharacterized protein LOC131539516 isoform X1 n=2 Tax=Onychostoma macrolepis TaxID=369639 RepID=UPI00272BDFCE|nr:uncharacterized protein LOC131539516 isoform X1 [Onychostoma macrolepis]
MWIRAVWTEPNGEEEGVIPEVWVRDNMVHWPPGANVTKAAEEMHQPASSWKKFPLLKIKIKSKKREVCEAFDQTTTAELSEEECSPVKRVSKKKKYPGFILDVDECTPDGSGTGCNVWKHIHNTVCPFQNHQGFDKCPARLQDQEKLLLDPGLAVHASCPTPCSIALHTSGHALLASGPVLQASGPVLHARGPALHASGPVLHVSGPVLHASGPVLQASGPVLHVSGPVLHKL